MASLAMVVLAASVALGYFTIATVIAPRIIMPSAPPRMVLVIRGAAIAFLTHVHILVHALGGGAAQPIETHEIVFHSVQAVGAWLFIIGALLRLELHVVPSQARVRLEREVEQQRQIAEQAQTLARHDELTGLARRWRFDEELARQVARARRYGTGGALILLDLDGLKTVNDTFGHQAGDAALEHIADLMRHQLRSSDVPARIGGDEFAIILPEAGLAEANRSCLGTGQTREAVAERIVASARGAGGNSLPKTSVSAGVTQIAAELTAHEVMKQADDALYKAKRAGGDRRALHAQHALVGKPAEPHPPQVESDRAA